MVAKLKDVAPEPEQDNHSEIPDILMEAACYRESLLTRLPHTEPCLPR